MTTVLPFRAWLVATVLGLIPVGLRALSSTRPAVPLEVELTRSLSSQSMHVGDEVLGKVKETWSDGRCRLAAASVIHGKVLSADFAAKHKTVALSFEYRCASDNDEPHKLIWLALLAPLPVDDGHRLITAGFHSPSFGEGGGLGQSGNSFHDTNRDMSGRQNATLPISYQDSDADKRHSSTIKTGEVWKLPHLKLEVGKGPEQSSVLSSTEKTLHLPVGSILVLLPESAAYQPVAHTAGPALAAPLPPAVKLPPEIGPCLPAACTSASTALGGGTVASTPVQSISLAHLGYGRLKSAEMRDLDFGAAVAFLGPDQLLFTFNPHMLVPREPTDRPEDRPHMVRAVLFDRSSGAVVRTESWRVPDDRQYLWVVDGEHVAVHDGDRLRWLGPGLLETQSLALGGSLAWLRVSPDRQHYAVATVHELHTPREHAELAAADAAGPEEQVLVRLLDGGLRPVGELVASSRALPPVLLDAGRVELWRTGKDTYYLRETAWATAGQRAPAAAAESAEGTAAPAKQRSFARVRSACVPHLTSLAANLLMEEGCRGVDEDRWVRVLRPDGSPVLETGIGWREFAPMPASGGGSGLFALTVAGMNVDHVRGSPFHGTDLHGETVRVYRAGDGREIFAARISDPLPARQPVALSPDGRAVAVIDGGHLLLYPAASPLARAGQP